jgi:dethiobiotin synthetase
MTGLFFTGTDTGVGKTTVAAAVTRILRRQGRHVRVCKPVATGARRVGARLVCDDSVVLADASGQGQKWEDVTPFAFAEPLAPAVAARRQGVRLTLEGLVDAVQRLAGPETIVMVEGVGGLLCPLTDKETIADLAVALRFPLVVVTRRSLGTLNHTLLTLEVARGRELAVAGVVVNETEPAQGIAAQTNVQELRQRIGVPLLRVVPFRADVAAALSEIDWLQLAECARVPRT